MLVGGLVVWFWFFFLPMWKGVHILKRYFSFKHSSISLLWFSNSLGGWDSFRCTLTPNLTLSDRRRGYCAVYPVVTVDWILLILKTSIGVKGNLVLTFF